MKNLDGGVVLMQVCLCYSGVKNSVHELGPNQTQLYTWENSLGKREMVYTCGNKKDVKNDLSQVCPPLHGKYC